MLHTACWVGGGGGGGGGVLNQHGYTAEINQAFFRLQLERVHRRGTEGKDCDLMCISEAVAEIKSWPEVIVINWHPQITVCTRAVPSREYTSSDQRPNSN